MARHDGSGEIVEAAFGIIIVIILFGVFYTTSSPIQSFFQNIVNEILAGIFWGVVIAITIVLLYLFFRWRSDN